MQTVDKAKAIKIHVEAAWRTVSTLLRTSFIDAMGIVRYAISHICLPALRERERIWAMGHRGQRSEEAEIRRAIRRIALDQAFNDRIVKEKVCLSSAPEVMTLLAKMYPDLVEGISPSIVEDLLPGLVLTDSYGHGAFQTC